MKFTLEVGDREKSRIEFWRNPWTGAMQTRVHGEQRVIESLLQPSTHFGFGTRRLYEFAVGTTESHTIVLEKERPWLLAGFRLHTYRVFLDGRLIHQQTGY